MPTEATAMTINFHTSQITHGQVEPLAFEAGSGDLFINLGYTPSMVRIMPVDGDMMLVLARMFFYSHDVDSILELDPNSGTFVVLDNDALGLIELVEHGFTVNKDALVGQHALTTGFSFEAFGPLPEDSEDYSFANPGGLQLPNQQLSDTEYPY